MCRLNPATFILLTSMQIHILDLGSIKARATEMIQGISLSRIRHLYEIDAEGYIRLSLRGLLVINGEQVVLFDPGCADFLPSRLMKEYGLETPESIETVLQRKGVGARQVTDVVFTHLHFDHGSGAFKREPGRISKRFPRARYHVLKEHYDYALNPDPFESDSFFTRLFRYVDQIHWLEEWKEDWMEYSVYNGHTRGMVVPRIIAGSKEYLFLSDLIPMKVFFEKGLFSGYDLNPELVLREKEKFLHSFKKSRQVILFHDPLIDSIYYP